MYYETTTGCGHPKSGSTAEMTTTMHAQHNGNCTHYRHHRIIW